MMTNYTTEIEALHQFFQDFFNGTIASSRISRFREVLAPDFHIIGASGGITSRDDIIGIVERAHDGRENFRIWIESVVLQQKIHDVLIVTYEEWQSDNETTTKRTSTVIFREDDTMPNGLIWLHVHESGLQTVDV